MLLWSRLILDGPTTSMRHLSYLCLVACLFCIVGCRGSDRELYHVSGTVNFKGQPVPAGVIFFEPDASVGNDGTQGYAEILDGRFNTADTGKGITGGAYQVRVRGFIPPAGGAPGRLLFKDYRQTLELPAADSQQTIEVPPDAGSQEEDPENAEPLPEIT